MSDEEEHPAKLSHPQVLITLVFRALAAPATPCCQGHQHKVPIKMKQIYQCGPEEAVTPEAFPKNYDLGQR